MLFRTEKKCEDGLDPSLGMTSSSHRPDRWRLSSFVLTQDAAVFGVWDA